MLLLLLESVCLSVTREISLSRQQQQQQQQQQCSDDGIAFSRIIAPVSFGRFDADRALNEMGASRFKIAPDLLI